MTTDGAYTTPNGTLPKDFEGLAKILVDRHIVRRTAARIVSGHITLEQAMELESYVLWYLSEKREKVMALQRAGKLKYWLWQVINRQINSGASWYHRNIRLPRQACIGDIYGKYEEGEEGDSDD